MNELQTLKHRCEVDGQEPRSCCLEPVADAWKFFFMTKLSNLVVIRRSWSKSRNIFWEQFGAVAACIVLLSWLPHGNSGAKRSMGSDTETNLRKQTRGISRGCLALVMVLASVSCSVSAWGLEHNLSVNEAPEKASPTTSPAKLGFSENRALQDTWFHEALPRETPLMGQNAGDRRVSGLVTIFILPPAYLPVSPEPGMKRLTSDRSR
jgi:hypothetical protein